MKKLFLCALMTTLGTLEGQAKADSYRTYSASDAVNYATYNYDRPYGPGVGQNNFWNYHNLIGGNCTNFVSQAIMAGMVGSQNVSTVYGNRTNYDVDKYSVGGYDWFFISDGDRGPAWTGADKLREYAKYNKSTYKGLHFKFVTNDTLTTFMDYKLVQAGDVVFADLDHDGDIDHSMLVTNIQTWRAGYDEVRLTYQGSSEGVGQTNVGLGQFNIKYNYQAVFYVYRPVDYNPNGL